MSQENVEVVKALYKAWNGPDGRHAALAFIADDFEWVNPSYAVEPGTRYGHAGWSAAMDNLEAAFHHDSHEPMEFRDLGDRVLCFTTFTARTSPDGVAFTQDEPHLWTLRDSKIVRLEWFHDRTEALEAAGLAELPMSQENVELVRGAFSEFERGNFWVGDIFHPDVRIVWLDALAGGETESLGVESMAATVREWLRTWERMTMTAERITVVGDQVLVIATWRGRGITSEAPAEWRHGQVWTMRDGQVISLVSFPDPTDALEAVGLSE